MLVKVFDGIVVATDSATTVALPGGSHQVYNGADKIFHLHRDLPICSMTWGLGQIGAASISTLAKDLRLRLMGKDQSAGDWALDPDAYTVEQVAQRQIEMFHSLYATEHQGNPAPPSLGMLIAGYSAGVKKGEAWKFVMSDPATPPVAEVVAGPDQGGWAAFAQPEATTRLFHGVDLQLQSLTQNLCAPDKVILDAAIASLRREPVIPAMPFSDAIQFAKFLVDVTVGYSHFLLGPDTVGGPVEVAGISRHEGFKWISRKHYYPSELNRREHGHA